MEKITILRKKPGEIAEWIEIDNSLRALQDEVGGYIETFTLTSGVVFICNEEGRIQGMPFNCHLAGVDFFGPVLIAGRRKDRFANLRADRMTLDLVFPELFKTTEGNNG